MYYIAICDDNKADRDYLRRLLSDHESCPSGLAIHEFSSGDDLLRAMEKVKFAVIILDIKRYGKDGNEIAFQIRQRDSKLLLIFISACVEPSPSNFVVQPYRYLKKQMLESELNDYIFQIFARMIYDAVIPSIVAFSDKKTIIIYPGDIIYIEKFRRRSRIHITPLAVEGYRLKKHDVIITDYRLKELYEVLKYHGFGFPHDSYIVNLRFSSWTTKTHFELKGIDFQFSISRSKAQEFNEHKKWFLTSICKKGC